VRTFHSLAELPEELKPNAIAFGKFDGVHIGHRALLDFLAQQAHARGLPAVVLTFRMNPLTLLDPQHSPPDIVSPAQKLELIARSDIDATILAEFDESFARIPAERFVGDVLVRRLGVEHVVVGRDFRFGDQASGDVPALIEQARPFGIEVHVLPDVGVPGDARVSASEIRGLLSAGRVAQAAVLLDRPHAVRGRVVQGDRRGRDLGFPTANLQDEPEGFVPGDGVYAGWLTARGERMPAAISVGTNPTFEGVLRPRIEAHVLDRSVELYGETVTVEFVEWVRGMVAFDGLEPLVEAIRQDVEQARRLLAPAR